MSKIRIITPEELAARDQQLAAEERNRPPDAEESMTTRRPTQQSEVGNHGNGANFERSYPNIAHFVDSVGYIEFGRDDESPLTSFIRAFDMGGIVWEGQDSYKSLDEAFQDLEQGLGEWMAE